MKNTTEELAITLDCEQEGYNARSEGRMRVVSQKVLDHIGDVPVGQPRTIRLMQAFYAGWQRHEDEEMRALGFPVPNR